jgi:DNA polymerase I
MYQMVIVDGMSILFRSFYSIKDMRNSRNQHIGAVYGFTLCLLNLIERYGPKYLVVALDTSGKTWRHEMLVEYKSNRASTPPDLIPQFTMMREACNAFGVKYYEGSAAEADDWIASCANQYTDSGDILIVSSDKDLLQLVSDQVHVYDPGKKIIIKAEDVLNVWGVLPNQICDLLALAGDSADCVGGVRGIGMKTAAKWLTEYNDLDSIVKNIPNLKPISRQNMLLAGVADAIQSRQLIKLLDSLTLLPIEHVEIKPCVYSLKKFLEQSEMPLVSRAEKVMHKYIRT